MPKHRAGEDERLRRLQRQLGRQVKGSRRHEKTKLAIAKIYARQARRRHDFAHKVSHTLATTHSLVGTEDLKVKNMTASASGTVENPGKNVAAKRGLNKAIMEQCWGLISELLDYKCEWYGSYHNKCSAVYSSQECSNCGHTHQDNRKTQALFKCVECGHTAHADTNGAKVIKKRNIEIAAQERAAMRTMRAEDVKTKREAIERRRAQRETSGELAAWLAIIAKQKLEQGNNNCSTTRGQRVAARGGSEVLARRNENLVLGDSIPAPELLPTG
jgi:putative transposase